MGIRLVYVQTSPMTWEANLCDDFNVLYPVNYEYFQYDSIPMVTGVTDFLCEYYNGELSRIFYFISQTISGATVIELATLLVSSKFINSPLLPEVAGDKIPNAIVYIRAALETAKLHLPYLRQNYPQSWYLENALFPPVIEKPVINQVPVQVEAKPTDMIEQQVDTRQEVAPVKAITLETVPLETPPVITQENQDNKSELESEHGSILEIASDDESDASSQASVPKIALEPSVNQTPQSSKNSAKNKRKKQKQKAKQAEIKTQTKPTQATDPEFDLVTSGKPNILSWAYNRLTSIKPPIKLGVREVVNLASLNYLVSELADYSGYINRAELWQHSRSRLTPNAMNTAFVMFCASTGYIVMKKALDKPITDPRAASVHKSLLKLKNNNN